MRTKTLSFAVPLLFSTLISALTLDCTHIRVDKKKFNFGKLGGPHSITTVDKDRPPAIHNTTYTIDICQKLDRIEGIPKAEQCPSGTYVCGIESVYNSVEDTEMIVEGVIPIAGNYETTNGKGLEPKFSRLKNEDTQTEGLRMELHGGQFNKKNQMAIIEFQCDLDRSGNEGFEAVDAKLIPARAAGLGEYRGAGAADMGSLVKDDNSDEKEGDGKSLSFVSYGSTDEKTDLLRLNWRTKYACEDFEDDDDDSPGKSSHWGFFTWFIILAFLGIATYLIFGSWLNYNRYGARGWDLLPHGDTIRDIPYLFKDWSKKVVDTVQGGGSRGGYSAV